MPVIPTVIESDGRAERAFDIYSRLLRDRIVLRFDDDGVVDLRVVATDGGSLVEVRESTPSWSTAIEFMGSSVGVRLQSDLHSDSACAIR